MKTLRKLFEGDASSKMTLDLKEGDTGSSGSSGPTVYRRRRGKGKNPREVTEASGRTPPRLQPLLHRQRRGWTRPPTSPRSGWRKRRRRPHGAGGWE